jgi:NADH-quinone oxidoreductase subunit L
MTAVAIGVSFAVAKYGRKAIPVSAPTNVTVWTKVARRDLLQDDFNEAVFMRPGQSLTRVLAFLDKRVVDGAVSGVGAMTLRLAGDLRKTQTGYVRSYALLILLGTVAILTAILVVTL